MQTFNKYLNKINITHCPSNGLSRSNSYVETSASNILEGNIMTNINGDSNNTLSTNMIRH